jgi:hypothetical protein
MPTTIEELNAWERDFDALIAATRTAALAEMQEQCAKVMDQKAAYYDGAHWLHLFDAHAIEAIVRDAHDQLVQKAVADVLSDVSYSVRRSLAENIGPIVKAVAKAMATNLAINHKRDQIIKALTGG